MKKFYIYESHLGGLFYTDHELTRQQRYCEQCGDTDWLACVATKPGDVLRCFADDIDIGGRGGYDGNYIIEFLESVPWEYEEEE